MNWGGAFAEGSWERGGASDSEGEDNSPSGRSTARRPLSAQLMVKVANWDTVGPVAGGFAASAGDGIVAGGNAVADWAPGAASGAGDFAGNAAGAVAGFFS